MSAESSKSVVNFENCTVVLLDIAGTTTSINSIKDTFYAYATKHAEEFLKAHWDDENVKGAVKLLKDEELDIDKAVTVIKELTELDSPNAGLKKIQALVCQKGFEAGEIKTSLFPDVPLALESWSKSRKIAVYSTGNTLGQQLQFTHTTAGDFSSYIQHYFDQTVGSKSEVEAYEKIASKLEVKPEEIVYITDQVEEAKAAKGANVSVVLVTREGNVPLPKEASKEFTIISSFKEISFENVSKRKNEEEAAPVEVRSRKIRKH